MLALAGHMHGLVHKLDGAPKSGRYLLRAEANETAGDEEDTPTASTSSDSLRRCMATCASSRARMADNGSGR